MNARAVLKSRNEKMVNVLAKRSKGCTYILGGGGLFPSDNYKGYLMTALNFLVIKYLKHGKNYIYGVDLCDIRDPRSKLTWKFISWLCKSISVRNKFSKELLSSACGVKNVESYSDVTFGLTTSCESDLNKLEEIETKIGFHHKDKKYIVWALAMPWGDNELSTQHFHDRYELLVNQYVELADRYSQRGYHHVFIPFFHNRDRIIIGDVVKSMRGEYTIVDEYDVPLEAKRALFMNASAVISMRFHGVAFALRHGIPVCALSYSQKITELMKECGLSDYCIEYGIRSTSTFFKEFDFDFNKLMEVTDRAVLYGDKEAFKKAQDMMVNKAKAGESVIKDMFGGRD